MLVTISVPDETVAILYVTKVHNGDYVMESDPEKITFDMIVKVEQE